MYYLSMYLCIYIYMFTLTDYALVIFNKNKVTHVTFTPLVT